MKAIIITLVLPFISMTLQVQKLTDMEKRFINTTIGEIAVYQKKTNSDKTPIIFLHGVYFDHHLWENQIAEFNDRTVIAIDMPTHGDSKSNIMEGWNLNDNAGMLLEILDSLKIDKVIAIGHSWGSMTIIRAAHKTPNRFKGLGLCNMPFKSPSNREKRNIRLQHSALFFRKFYMKQAGKALMGKESLEKNPGLLQKLINPMSRLTNKEIKHTDIAVRINAEDVTQIIDNLSMPSIALVGEEDYVGVPPMEQTITVNGGHVSPLEVPEEVNKMIVSLIKIVD